MKEGLRREVLGRRSSISAEEIREKSDRILEQLISMEEFQEAEEIFTFVSFGTEVNTHSLIHLSIELGKRVFVPRVMEKGRIEFFQFESFEKLVPSKFGILEPMNDLIGEIAGKRNQLMVMPGVAFDRDGHRLGYGGGFYDRYLSRNSHCQIPKFALCYDLQLVASVPVEEFDQVVDRIITETCVIQIK